MVSVNNLTRTRTPAVSFQKIAEYVLGRRFNLSIVLAGTRRMQTLNRRYRRRNRTTNVLSFALSPCEGEVYLNIPLARTEARQAGERFTPYLAYLFIHGLLHLKGFGHGSKMESEEKKIRVRFGYHMTKDAQPG